ncbi:pilus assembly protein CpaF [Janibacter sp. Soil728]|uniref:TadA family conjugal transfer-associated ATPase n=1 Tax=Janibacter sp. Soil728 TaxID=1736393 RepID=UPI0006F74FE2|nr:TadA family conjugal transfer-associated ATPase [Janibacter sp. Soil728]KRE35059.1 pilus assembly protein CpaF [Janibacter sp. Soil728]
MKWSSAIDAHVQAGRAPDERVIEEVARSEGVRLGGSGALRRSGELRADLMGLGALEPLVRDERVTDVLVNGDGSVWVDRGCGVTRADVEVGDEEAVRRLATRLSALAGRRLDDAQPWVDGLLPRGIRLHAVLPPLVAGGAHVSLRIPRHRGGGLSALVDLQMATPEQAEQLRAIVRERQAYVVTGGTGTGKTTLLAALLAEVPADERLVVVEDVGEIQVGHPHVVRLQARSANTEGAGEVTMVHLVRQALRMRPDRLVVGEVRGAEVRDLLLALNTGHEGGCGTLHANRAEDVPSRLEALGALAGMSREAVRAQVASALEVVVHLRRVGGRRVVDSIGPLPRVAS